MIGSGPAGIYAAGALAEHDDVTVDVIDKLPCPFGLVRYGVAPDHPKIKSISAALTKFLEEPAVRFLGNVEVGKQVTVQELHQYYDAVLFTFGSAVDRRLGIPGEDLPGSYSATDFVAWYSGHPDAPVDGFTLDASSVAVIGAGNVALDVARLLAKSADELRRTDLPEHVLRVLEESKVEDIHVIARRGPVQAKFTTKELREVGELDNADVLVDPVDVRIDEGAQQELTSRPAARRNVEVLQTWSERPLSDRSRRIHMWFRRKPVKMLGDSHVTGLQVEETTVDDLGNAVGTGRLSTVEAQTVFRSVGYRGHPLPGLPFDESTGTIPNEAGRVLRDGIPVPGEYVAGWIKRGPTGVIGTNKRDAQETVRSLLADVDSLARAPFRDQEAFAAMLRDRGVRVVDWHGWRAIAEAEAELGRTQGRERTKIVDRDSLLQIAAGDTE